MEDNNNNDSDSNSGEDSSSQDYYEPISSLDLDNNTNDEENNYHHPINGDNTLNLSNGLSNGHCLIPEAISSININGDVESEEEEIETETESEIRRAFEEDERRRRSPLMEENAIRVMEAMRAISFPGMVPDWASEDRWIDQLRRLRSSTSQ